VDGLRRLGFVEGHSRSGASFSTWFNPLFLTPKTTTRVLPWWNNFAAYSSIILPCLFQWFMFSIPRKTKYNLHTFKQIFIHLRKCGPCEGTAKPHIWCYHVQAKQPLVWPRPITANRYWHPIRHAVSLSICACLCPQPLLPNHMVCLGALIWHYHHTHMGRVRPRFKRVKNQRYASWDNLLQWETLSPR
jgi:hypothetical protein